MAPSYATEKTSNISAQLVPHVHNCQKYLGKFTSYMTIGVHKLKFRAIFGLPVQSLTLLLLVLYSDVRKNFYTGAHLHSRP